ncbi:hypothetical protein FACS1894152_2950 [Bacilli bacterium]|nr:hypothetical protein FACS1894152_2950 [Bacilli bacterium]
MATLKAYGKINLVLKVFPRRQKDAKHKIHSLMILDKTLYDQISITPSETFSITYYNNNKTISINNCVITKSIAYLQNILKTKLCYQIVVYKQIPFMSGLGGSATDAASIILYILKQYHKEINVNQLKYIALHIGSDIPFFLSQLNAAEVKGYGDKVQKFNITKIKYSLHLTHIPITSQRVYRELDKNLRYVSQVNFKKCVNILRERKRLYFYHGVFRPYGHGVNL